MFGKINLNFGDHKNSPLDRSRRVVVVVVVVVGFMYVSVVSWAGSDAEETGGCGKC